MPRISKWFFAAGSLYAIVGMLVGMYMGGSESFTLAPAHAHWNLLGWVTMSLYGTFYALAGSSVSERRAKITFVLANLGVLVMIPSLALYLISLNKMYIPSLVAGEILTLAGMVSFALSVFSTLRR